MGEKMPLPVTGPVANSLIVETERLRLRIMRDSDLDDLATMFADPDVMRYVGNGLPADRAEAKRAIDSIVAHWERHGFGRWAVEDKETQEFVGYGGLRSLFGTPEVVYHLVKRHWGQGFATEVGRASLNFGFNVRGFARIVAIAKPENLASIHVMKKLGMHFEMQTSYYGIEVVQYATSPAEFNQQ
ncbi:MAG TPA: GNAT family N-acetyltransferase [Pyrinomonadaceae bacterium]|nr:GNAT family N-acetyltransferase [Pyrinomonadaceae bacterium]